MEYVSLDWLPRQIFEKTPALKGGFRVTRCVHFRTTDTDKNGKDMKGVRLVQLEGTNEFLKSLYKFHRGERFGLGMGFVQIAGGQ